MSPEMPRGYRQLPAFVLLVLAQEPGHGAAVHGRLGELLPVVQVESGAVYRTLATLEAHGEVAGTWDTSARGPARKVYRITPLGWDRLESWCRDISGRVRLLTGFLHMARQALRHRPSDAP